MNRPPRIVRPPTPLERVDCIVGHLDGLIEELEHKVMAQLSARGFSDGELQELQTACVALARAQARLRRVSEGTML